MSISPRLEAPASRFRYFEGILRLQLILPVYPSLRVYAFTAPRLNFTYLRLVTENFSPWFEIWPNLLGCKHLATDQISQIVSPEDRIAAAWRNRAGVRTSC
jgi:hypothetical protein